MSSDESDASPPRQIRKRKVPQLEDSPASTSSGSPVIGTSSRRPRRRPLERNVTDSEESNSDSGSSVIVQNHRRKIAKVKSDSDDDSSDSSLVRRSGRTRQLSSDSESVSSMSCYEASTSSQWETDTEIKAAEVLPQTTIPTSSRDNNVDSDTSDGQSEKCPICLISFKTQMIGTPESCDHIFCLECLQEWSKNMNTCPVDRQEYASILVRKKPHGKVVKRIPIDKPSPQNDVDIVEDPTYCEICGARDNEDRMLLCDGCDLGFHLYCLTPPMESVPAGAWFCNECGLSAQLQNDDYYQIEFFLNLTGSMDTPRGRRRNLSARLIPRTRQTERVRRRIANSRHQSTLNVTDLNRSVQDTERVSSTTTSRKRKRSRRKIRYKTVYEIDEATGETVAVKKRQVRSRRRRKKKRPAKPRLTCNSTQNTPPTTNSISEMRDLAGIPRLYLFGQQDEIDYFSGEDFASSETQVITRRAPSHSDVVALRRVARRKAQINITSSNVSSSTDLLDSILESQDRFHSKNASYSVDSSGNVQVHLKKSKDYVNLNKQEVKAKETPNNYQNRNYNYNNRYRYYPNSYNRRPNNNYNTQGQNYYNSNSNNWQFQNNYNYRYGGGEEENCPQDYTQRTLCASSEPDNEQENITQEEAQGEGDEVDIYSDIETVSTSKADEIERPPSPPPPIAEEYDDNNDSEPDMVIDDDERVQEETAVSSTVSFTNELPTLHSNPPVSDVIQSEAVQSSNNPFEPEFTESHSVYQAHDPEDIEEEDEGCPNFSIYSKESKNVALHTDLSLSAGIAAIQQEYQVSEVSSSPNIEGTKTSADDAYDPAEPSRDEDQEEEVKTTPLVDYVSEGAASPEAETNQPNQEEEIPQAKEPKPAEEKTECPPNEDNAEKTEENETEPQEKETPNLEENTCLPTTTATQQEVREEPKLTQAVKSKVEIPNSNVCGGLYSDSEDEAVVKKDNGPFGLSDINHMTEDISEEERSYTPCLDEKRQGLEGLDTELISDEDRNDFDESHELKTVSDGDALEINAKESELELRPEDYEEGEIVDKNKEATASKSDPEKETKKPKPKKDEKENKKLKKKEKEKPVEQDKTGNKENEKVEKGSFKKLSKSTKERNYRDKDKKEGSPQKSKEIKDQSAKKDKKKEKRREIERYNVRAVIAEKPRPIVNKDQFGRDILPRSSSSRSRSYTPPPRRSTSRRRTFSRSLSRARRSLSHRRRSASKDRNRKTKKDRSRNYRSLTKSRSRSPAKKRANSKTKKRKRSTSREKRRKQRDRSKNKNKKPRRSRSRHRSRTPSPQRRRNWSRREWTPSLSVTPSLEQPASPSWTPPRLLENTQLMRNPHLTVTLNNTNKKKKEKRKKLKRNKEPTARKRRRFERERTPPPSKEVFASGDNILVSVSFNNENEVRDVTTRDKRKEDGAKKKKKKSKNRKDLSGVKPVAIIDLARSPFRELTPSPKNIIILTDSENEEQNSNNVEQGVCDSSQQVASPEREINYSMGPKTPPEPQIKFSLNPKTPQIRAISNPLHEPDDMETNDDVQEEISEAMHKGPNTPPEPPNSPPSSPDAYDPFEPTKSRSPTPDPLQNLQSSTSILNLDDNNQNTVDSRTENLEKGSNLPVDAMKSLTPPLLDVQPADSQSSIQATPESTIGKSPERGSVTQTIVASKPVVQGTPFSSVPTSMITSTPVSTNLAPTRINILNATVISAPTVASSIPQRIVLPNQVKSSPVKISPTKPTVKSTPIKPMPNKNKTAAKKRIQNGGSIDDLNITLDFDSPYSPGSSDYEDLFEPPSEIVTKPVIKNKSKSPQKHLSTFDTLFGSSPTYRPKNIKNDKNKYKKNQPVTKTKTVGVKLDEDCLKILDELPNSAVEMQVKDKFLKKLNRQERVVEEVKLVLKPHYNKKRINKEEYKDILRRAVPKICHNKSGEINPTKIKNLIEAYVKKLKHSKKVTSSSSVNPQKV